MPVQHVKTDGVGDFTGTVTVFNSQASTTTVAATNLVRPSDWNSAHQLVLNAGGNTLGSSQVSGTDLVWAGGSNITLSLDTLNSRISIIAAGPVTLSSYVPNGLEVGGANSIAVALGVNTSGVASFWPISINDYVSAGMVNMIFNASWTTNGTSSGRQSAGVWFAMYTRGTGTNSTTMGSIERTSFSWAVTGNNSSYTISQPTASNYTSFTYSTTSSAGVAISSQYTGSKLVMFPINAFLTPGIYWGAILGTKSSSSTNVGLSLSVVGGSYTQTALAPIGSLSISFGSGTAFAGSQAGVWGFGHGSFQSANQTDLPVSLAFSAITAGINIVPYMKFWST